MNPPPPEMAKSEWGRQVGDNHTLIYWLVSAPVPFTGDTLNVLAFVGLMKVRLAKLLVASLAFPQFAIA